MKAVLGQKNVTSFFIVYGFTWGKDPNYVHTCPIILQQIAFVEFLFKIVKSIILRKNALGVFSQLAHIEGSITVNVLSSSLPWRYLDGYIPL
jgi:hypothetical protein